MQAASEVPHCRSTEESVPLSGPIPLPLLLRVLVVLFLIGNYGGMVYIYGVIYNREPVKPSYWGTLFAPPSSASPSVLTGDEDDGEGQMPH